MSDTLHLEILDAPRKEVFFSLRHFRRYGFLAGGTALALQIHHRFSYDFDVFCTKEITPGMIRTCREIFSFSQVLVHHSDELSFLTKHKIKITFLYYPFVFPGKLIPCSSSLDLLNILNIATSKVYTLNRRAQYRDYVDLYFVLRFSVFSLEHLIKNAHKVYGNLFSEKLFLGQLLYIDDLERSELKSIRYIAGNIASDEIFSFLEKEVRKYQKMKIT